jgi:hypothetical protein
MTVLDVETVVIVNQPSEAVDSSEEEEIVAESSYGHLADLVIKAITFIATSAIILIVLIALAEGVGILICLIFRCSFNWTNYQQYIEFFLIGGFICVLCVRIFQVCCLGYKD